MGLGVKTRGLSGFGDQVLEFVIEDRDPDARGFQLDGAKLGECRQGAVFASLKSIRRDWE